MDNANKILDEMQAREIGRAKALVKVGEDKARLIAALRVAMEALEYSHLRVGGHAACQIGDALARIAKILEGPTMTHEQRIKALIEAGEKAPQEELQCLAVGAGFRRTVCDGDEQALLQEPTVETFRTDEEIRAMLVLAKDSANARDSIKLLAEIAEAAANYRALTQSDPHPVGAKLDALLAKYKPKEAQDAE